MILKVVEHRIVSAAYTAGVYPSPLFLKDIEMPTKVMPTSEFDPTFLTFVDVGRMCAKMLL